MYRWIARKRKGKVHEVRPDGKTYCQTENNSPKTGARLTTPTAGYPTDRQLCWCCQGIKRDGIRELNRNMDREFMERMGAEQTLQHQAAQAAEDQQ